MHFGCYLNALANEIIYDCVQNLFGTYTRNTYKEITTRKAWLYNVNNIER